jgi:DNA polymerase-3 subunit beta
VKIAGESDRREMKITISKDVLSEALGVVSKCVDARSEYAYMSGVHIKTVGESVIFETTNTNQSARFVANALVEEQGELLVSYRRLSEIAKVLPDAAVTVEDEDGKAVVTCQSSRLIVPSHSTQDYPGFPTLEPEASITLPMSTFRILINEVAYAAATKADSGLRLMGVYIEVADSGITAVATDSYRVSVAREKIPTESSFTVLIPASFSREISQLKGDMITLGVTQNQVIARCDTVRMISRIYKEEYVPYHIFFKHQPVSSVMVNCSELAAAVKRALAVSEALTAGVSLRLDDSGILAVSHKSRDESSYEELTSETFSGDVFSISVSGSYLIEALKVISTPEVLVNYSAQDKPLQIQPSSGEAISCAIMPIRSVA